MKFKLRSGMQLIREFRNFKRNLRNSGNFGNFKETYLEVCFGFVCLLEFALCGEIIPDAIN